LLAETQLPAEGPRKQAELHLLHAQSNPAFPTSLAAIASHGSVAPEIRQSALSVLRRFVEKNWSGQTDDEGPAIPIADATKEQLRVQLLQLATSNDENRRVKSAASYVVSKIANIDFPDDWPALLPTLLQVIPNATDSQLHGALKVLSDLVEDSLSEDQFFSVARDIIKTVYDVAVNEGRKYILRALAVSVFRGCFDIMDMVKDEHGPEVKGFAEEALSAWSPYFLEILKKSLPARPQGEDEGYESARDDKPEAWRGVIALKLQVVKTLMKIRSVFPQLLLPQTPVLFSATWDELNLLLEPYKDMYVDNDEQGRLEDSDRLPYTLDFLVLEELDFLQSCLRAPPVQKELESQLQAHNGVQSTPWVMDVMKLAVNYAQIPKEEEELWSYDSSVFLAEETSVSANYTARTACGDLIIKLGEWLHTGALEGLLAYIKAVVGSEDTEGAWRRKESSLYLLTQLLGDFLDLDKAISPELARACLELVDYAIRQESAEHLRARGFLLAGILIQSIPDAPIALLDQTIQTIAIQDMEVISVSCIKAIQGFTRARAVPADRQAPIIKELVDFLSKRDLTDLEDADDLMVTLVESLRAAISIDYRVAIADTAALDLLFLIAKHGASSFQTTMLISETFEDIVSSLTGSEAYTALCTKVLPSLTGTFDVGNITQDDPLVELATELLALLTEHGTEPLPAGYVTAALPKLNRLLLATEDGGILRPGASAIKFMLQHDHQQVFSWTDEQGRSGLEVCLIIIDRLLAPSMEDNSASEVGGLAAELVEKAGQERLGPYLEQLLRAVATRLATAEAAPFIQSLILVFARLSLVGAQDVVNFLAQIEINGQSGLQVVLSKWLENSVNFAGYDEIRQKFIFSLNDQRIVQTMVKGDLIIPTSNPDQYTIIPANLKIVKVLIEELLSASGIQSAANAAAAAAAEFADEEGDDDGWEDMPNTLDLGLGSTKADLMAYGEGANFMRQRDDETQAYLSEFFVKAARENTGGFNELYAALTEDEKSKLNELAAQ
ncbi:hypothetical protein DH86_00003596, partial [Scytalidium sp. 3C]